MKLDDFLRSPAAASNQSGPHDHIVRSSRVRLARNLRGLPFPGWAKKPDRVRALELIRPAVESLPEMAGAFSGTMDELSSLDRQILVERHLISREHAAKGAGSGLVLNPDLSLCVMVNEEDHLRMQALRHGLQLRAAWQAIDQLDSTLERRLDYAFSRELGYLTACPTNVGTGMRASVMLHLPALEHTKQIDKVFRALQKINLAVRGLYGEGSRASGHFYQISNQVTLGKSESGILSEIHSVIPQIVNYERQARVSWLRDNRQGLHDKVSRAYGTLCSATMMTSEETMELLSYLRLGINLHLIEDLKIPTVNELFIHTQPAHLQKLMGAPLDGEERNAARARYLRTKLRENGAHPN